MREPLTLFGLHGSVYTRIAAMTLLEKGLEYSLETVDIFGPGGVPEEHFKRHPFGRIPALQHGDRLLYETSAICRYVDEAFPGPPLQPSAPEARARMNQVIGVLDAYGYRPMIWDVFVQRVGIPLRGGAPDEGIVAAGLSKTLRVLDALLGLLSDAPFFAGRAVTLADLHAYPMFVYFGLAREGAAALSARPPLAGWLAAMSARPSAARTRTPYEVS